MAFVEAATDLRRSAQELEPPILRLTTLIVYRMVDLIELSVSLECVLIVTDALTMLTMQANSIFDS